MSFNDVSILISSVGRRGQLIECFRESLRALGVPAPILGVDCSVTAPAAYLTDKFFPVPRCDAPEFLASILRICQDQHVSLLVPTIDTELAFYAAHKREFAEIGTTVAISTPETIEISADKTKTHQWLSLNGYPTVRQGFPEEVLERSSGWKFPLVVKPRCGSASVGVQFVTSLEMLRLFAEERKDLIVQEHAVGREYTVNVLADKRGKCVAAVPHLRLEVRAGEVSKGVTVKHRGVMDLVSRMVEQLPGAYGPLNIQCFVAPSGDIQVVEINSRFGGGYPLAHKAGADFPRWMLEELFGLPTSASPDGWEDGLTMLRYDTAVFLSSSRLGVDLYEEEAVHRV